MSAVAVQFGPRANWAQAARSYTPSFRLLASDLDEALADSSDLHGDIPLPLGMKISRPTDGRQFQIEHIEPFSLRRRRVWGYIGEMGVIKSEFTETGAHLQVVIFTPWMYGATSAENRYIWIYARVNCFCAFAPIAPHRFLPKLEKIRVLNQTTSAAAFSKPSRMLKHGGPVSGFLEATKGKHHRAQLTGWGSCTAQEWLKLSGDTSPPEFDLAQDAIYKIPQLSCGNFGSFYPPYAPYLFARSPSIPKYFQNESSRAAYAQRVSLISTKGLSFDKTN